MAIPSPEYYSQSTELSVDFFDLTTNSPVSWLWDFGDSTTSTSQNPTHVYAAAGTYNVRLTATNGDGSKDIVKIIMVDTVPIEFGMTIEEVVRLNLPGGLTLRPVIIPTLRKKWQLMMYANIDGLAAADIYNESAWPDEYNLLIAYCIIYDIFIMLFGEASINSMQMGSSTTNNAENINSNSGGVKRLVEGPAEVEWFDTSAHLANMFKSYGTGLSPFQYITTSGCAIASKLGVKVPFCKAPTVPMLFVKTDNPYKC